MKNRNNSSGAAAVPPGLARNLVLNELFDLALYKNMASFAKNETLEMLNRLIAVETGHAKSWNDFFGFSLKELNFARKAKLFCFTLFARIFGERGIHLLVEAIEVHGIRNYLQVWEIYKNQPLGKAVYKILYDEFKHEDEIVSIARGKRIHPERIRDIFLGLNDGLVEIVGAVSGLFAAFQTASAVLLAGFTLAIAGSISMAASAFAAVSSESEMEKMEIRRKRFLNESIDGIPQSSPASSAAVVGIFYLLGSSIPILPILFGAKSFVFSMVAALVVSVFISYLLAFISGMSVGRRIRTNVIIITIAVGFTYLVGVFTKEFLGIKI